ncbi:MAG: aerotolerance regulator BatA, partial [Chitinophagaceae bacterium]
MLYDWIKNMSFAYPENFMLFGLIPLLIWWYTKKYNVRQATIKVSAVKAFKVSTLKNYFRHVPFI